MVEKKDSDKTKKIDETSMEDILLSIREMAANEEDGDILELTNLVQGPSRKGTETASLKEEQGINGKKIEKNWQTSTEDGSVGEPANQAMEAVQTKADTMTKKDEIIGNIKQSITEIQDNDGEQAQVEELEMETSQKQGSGHATSVIDSNVERVLKSSMSSGGRKDSYLRELSGGEKEGELLSKDSQKRAEESLAHLVEVLHSQQENGTDSSNLTVIALVKELMRPMVKEWLEKNLPDIVRKVVDKEVKRITRDLED